MHFVTIHVRLFDQYSSKFPLGQEAVVEGRPTPLALTFLSGLMVTQQHWHL